ncbi:MAG: 3-hydroxybutyrate dehydrogenase [Vulcanimicrobiota bacterium]
MTTMKTNHALVTGGTSGIGYAMARRLADLGYRVSVNGLIDPSTLNDFLLSFGDSQRVRFAEADLADPGAIESMMKQAREEFGPISVLVNNAGVQHVSPVEEFSADKWEQIIAINLSSNFHTIRLAVPGMKEMGWGRIINLASAHSLVASPFKAAYVSAKHGVLGLTKTVALELAKHNITCVAICPGYVKTPLVEKQIPDTARARGMTEQEVVEQVLLAAQPTGRFVTVEQIADTMQFLLTDGAASITGTALSIDGGWTAQ